MSPWKIILIVTWVVVGLALAGDAVYCTLVGLEKIKVKERPEPKEDY